MVGLLLAATLAFVRGDAIVANGKVVTHGQWAAWSSKGRLAVARGQAIYIDGKRTYQGATPAWSPDGRLAYVRDRSIWVGAHRITRPKQFWQEDALPSWSPDGTWIAFAALRDSALHAELWRVRPDGTGLRRLTRTKDDFDDGMPSWTPDGRIVFVSTRDKNRELYLWSNGRVRRLTRTPKIDESLPKVSPDGTQVAFDDGRRVGVYTFATGRERFVGIGLAPAWVTPRAR